MSQPYVGEIRMFGGNFAPAGWMFCEGQLLPISENEVLFNLIGTTYGGDGQSTFALPDLRGRLPIHTGAGFVLAMNGGAESVTLTTNQMPAHTHTVLATTNPNTSSLPGGNFLASGPDIYDLNRPGNATMAAAIGSIGGSQPHDNFQPYLCISFILSLFGVFPSQS
ncbi:phage tail protein [Acidicapsa acidisoli]|uniref:phage tail protein n=1 Tax=Acidicapsa acidisoli TaxID=1615681 RepID=UPI0021DF5AA8|nr:tail fiber protein [Acidicapsa acidisoli]